MPPAHDTQLLILFDGVCVFCDGAVRFLMERDATGVFHFAPLQGGTAAQLRARHPEISDDIDSIVVVETGGGAERVYQRSESILRVLAELPAPWRWFRVLGVLPRPLLDLLYRAFARIRYRAFGRLDTCRVPSTAERTRILP